MGIASKSLSIISNLTMKMDPYSKKKKIIHSYNSIANVVPDQLVPESVLHDHFQQN